MINAAFSSYQIFSGGQIAGIVLVCVLLAGLIALNVYLILLLKKRGEHKMHSEQLQSQREALMSKLSDMKSGKKTDFEKFEFKFLAYEDDKDEDADADADADESDAEIEEEAEETFDVEVTAEGNVVRYNRSFEARIIQANLDLKARYSELKNYILSYKGVSEHLSWKKEAFRVGRKELVEFVVRGKTLCLNLAADPTMFAGTKYKVIDLSEHSKKKSKVPSMFRITSDRSTSYAKELVDIVMAGFHLAKKNFYEPQDFTFPYRSTEALVKRKLIKIMGGGIPDFEREEALAAARRIRYNRSFEARIIQADDKLKEYYSALKNHVLAHAGVTANATWKKEDFRTEKETLASFFIRGKTLCVCMALDPKPFEGTKYRVQDLSTQVKDNKMPLLFKIRNARRVAYAKDLLDKMFAEHGIESVEAETVNYAVPFVSTDNLINRGLIKVIKNSDEDKDKEKDKSEGGETAPAEKRPTPRKRKNKGAAAEASETAEATADEAQSEAAATETVANDGKTE
ncbi:MAG: hypothetical protein J1G38_01020 [Clostridiales bacterium]|nr:hypothetical protein [Clostridiales bacterium]